MREGWEYKKLGEVCLIERGGSPRPITDFITDDANGVNWIKIGDATEGSKYISSTKEKIKPEGVKKSRFVHKGDFILSNSMSFGKPYILNIDGCIHDGWLVLHDKNDVFNKDYLYYLLSSPVMYSKFAKFAVGGVVNNLNSNIVRNVDVAIPPKNTQLTIASELDKINELIRLKKEQLVEYGNLAQSIFYDMFGDPVENEKGWEVKMLGEATEIIPGFAFPSDAFSNNNPIKVIKITNIGVGEFINDEASLPDSYNEKNDFKAKCGDIVIALTRTIISTGLKRAIVPNTYNNSLINQRVAAIKADEVLSKYLYHFLGTDFAKQYVQNHATALNQPNLSITDLRRLPLPLPPLPLQQSFASRIEQIEKLKSEVQNAINDLETLLASRMQYWFD